MGHFAGKFLKGALERPPQVFTLPESSDGNRNPSTVQLRLSQTGLDSRYCNRDS